MASYALALSTSKSFFFTSLKQPSFQCRFHAINQSHVPKSCNESPHKNSISSNPISNFSSGNFLQHKLCSSNSKRLCEFKVRSAAIPESRDEAVKTDRLVRVLQLGAMFVVWYLLNIYFNIFNKQVPFFCFSCFYSFFNYEVVNYTDF